MTKLTLYHAGMRGDYDTLHPLTHFATTIEPCIEVAGRKYFADRKAGDDWTPTLYTCEVQLNFEADLALLQEWWSPNRIALVNRWRDRYRSDLKRYSQIGMHMHDMSEDELLDYLKEEAALYGIRGYRYENTIEGGIGVCLLDCADVVLQKREPIPMKSVAEVLLRCSAQKLAMDEAGFQKARIEATAILDA